MTDVEAFESLGQQEDAIENRRREAMDMPGDLRQRRRPTGHTRADNRAKRAAPGRAAAGSTT